MKQLKKKTVEIPQVIYTDQFLRFVLQMGMVDGLLNIGEWMSMDGLSQKS